MEWLETKYLRLVSFRLRNFKQKRDTLWNFSCPFCGDSSSNSHKARGYVFGTDEGLMFHCHNCGVSAGFHKLLKHLDENLHREFVMEKFKEGRRHATPVPKISAPDMKKPEKPLPVVDTTILTPISHLPDDHFAVQYVAGRKIPEDRWSELFYVDDFKHYMDTAWPGHGKKELHENDKRLVWMMQNMDGEMIQVCGRTLTNSKLRYIKCRVRGEENERKVFGINQIDPTKTIYVVEGEIDSMFLKNTVAAGDAGLTHVGASLLAKYQGIPGLKVVLVFDNEPRNQQIVGHVERAIDQGHNVVIWPEMAEKDINEMVLAGVSPAVIQDRIEKNTYKGLCAKMKLASWRKW